jgi:peptidoglycan/LPS O-acetylase OafA/YrhL
VLYGHSFAIQPFPGIQDPLKVIFQGSTWIGAIAVNGFFAISGFLVAASLIKRGIVDYFISRILRIFPALIVCVSVSVFILGPLLTTLSMNDYFSHPKTWNYLGNALGILKMEWVLSGVFAENARHSMNGSLWSLTVETRCYLLLGALTYLGFRANKLIGNLLILTILAVGFISFETIPLVGDIPKWSRPTLYFAIGVLLYRQRAVRLSNCPSCRRFRVFIVWRKLVSIHFSSRPDLSHFLSRLQYEAYEHRCRCWRHFLWDLYLRLAGTTDRGSDVSFANPILQYGDCQPNRNTSRVALLAWG